MGEIDKGVTLSLAQVLLHTGDKEKAIVSYRNVLRINPDQKVAKSYLKPLVKTSP